MQLNAPLDGFRVFVVRFSSIWFFTLSNVISEYCIVHEFEEILLEIVLCLFSFFGVEVNILLQPV